MSTKAEKKQLTGALQQETGDRLFMNKHEKYGSSHLIVRFF